MNVKTILLVSCGVSALAVGSPAWAVDAGASLAEDQTASSASQPVEPSKNPDDVTSPQDDDPNQPGVQSADANAEGVRIESRAIVVTGTRFSEVLSLPQSKSLIEAEDRNLSGLSNVRLLADVTPGFNFTNEFGLNVRGIGRQTPQTTLGQENAVLQYVDGFLNLVPFNIAESTLFGGNVQFFRGPSGTRYGRNAIAGSANLLSRSPTPEFSGEFQADIGRGGSYGVGFNIAGPVTEDLGVRVGVQRFSQPSYSKNFGSAKDAGFAPSNVYAEFQLEWTLGDFHLRNRATHFYYDNQPGYPTLGRYDSASQLRFGLVPNPQRNINQAPPREPYAINVDYKGYDKLDNNFQDIFNADLDLGLAKLFYVGGYQQYIARGQSDVDLTSRSSVVARAGDFLFVPAGTVVPTDYRANYYNDVHYYTQELRLEGEKGAPVEWILGAYYINQDFDESYWESIPGAGAVLTRPTVRGTATLAPPNPRKAYFEQRNIYDIRSTAVFGNVEFNLTEKLRFDGGLRYTWDEKEAEVLLKNIFYIPDTFASDFAAKPQTFLARNDKGLSGRAALAYTFEPRSQIYASYARGYQSSAFSLGSGVTGPAPIADKEFLDVFEAGGNYTQGPIRFDGSVFLQKFHDMQIPISSRGTIVGPNGQPTPGLVFTGFRNAELAEIYGAEAQVTWKPNDLSNIVASYTYLHPTFDKFCPTTPNQTGCGAIDISQPATIGGVPNPLALPQDLSGFDVPRAPRHKASLFGYVGIDLGDAGYLFPGGNVVYTAPFFTSVFQADNRFRIPGRIVAGATLTYRTKNDRLDLTATVNNLFRNIYFENISPAASGNSVESNFTYGADRFYSLTMRYRL